MHTDKHRSGRAGSEQKIRIVIPSGSEESMCFLFLFVILNEVKNDMLKENPPSPPCKGVPSIY